MRHKYPVVMTLLGRRGDKTFSRQLAVLFNKRERRLAHGHWSTILRGRAFADRLERRTRTEYKILFESIAEGWMEEEGIAPVRVMMRDGIPCNEIVKPGSPAPIKRWKDADEIFRRPEKNPATPKRIRVDHGNGPNRKKDITYEVISKLQSIGMPIAKIAERLECTRRIIHSRINEQLQANPSAAAEFRKARRCPQCGAGKWAHRKLCRDCERASLGRRS